MKAHGMQNAGELEQYFFDQVEAIAQRLNRTLAFWQEPFFNGVRPSRDSILEVWTPHSLVNNTNLAAVHAIDAMEFGAASQLLRERRDRDVFRQMAAAGYRVITSQNWYAPNSCT